MNRSAGASHGVRDRIMWFMTETFDKDPKRRPRILVVDDDADVRSVLRELLKTRFEVFEAANAESALTVIESSDPDLVLLDLNLGPGPDGFEVLDRLAGVEAAPSVIVLSMYTDTESVVRAMKAGASHYIDKTPAHTELMARVDLALEERRREFELTSHRRAQVAEIVGTSSATVALKESIRIAAGSNLPVLILGETGTGKGLVARAVHRLSERSRAAFRDVNVAALAESVLDSELFGHERGAFTGADRRRRGLFELASGGTLLLDEIGDLPRTSQVKLLKVVEEGRLRRVGGENDVDIDTRVLAATHQDVDAMVSAGTFRRDLYHRLAGIVIRISPLRERVDDIPMLARSFLDGEAGLTDAAVDSLTRRDWPGNVRQLQHVLRRASLFATRGPIEVEHLDVGGLESPGASERIDSHRPYQDELREATDRFRRSYLTALLARCRGNVSLAARESGLSRAHLHELIKTLGIDTKSS